MQLETAPFVGAMHMYVFNTKNFQKVDILFCVARGRLSIPITNEVEKLLTNSFSWDFDLFELERLTNKK